jgi:hypothetical protein
MVGAPSSRVQLAIRLSRCAGDQFTPAPSVVRVPKSEYCSTSPLALSVRLPSAPKSLFRREIGRSMLIAAVPLVRPSDVELATSLRRRSLSRREVRAPIRRVVPDRPAGSLNSDPFITASMSPDRVRVVARSGESTDRDPSS